jgi:hypothetical protein
MTNTYQIEQQIKDVITKSPLFQDQGLKDWRKCRKLLHRYKQLVIEEYNQSLKESQEDKNIVIERQKTSWQKLLGNKWHRT